MVSVGFEWSLQLLRNFRLLILQKWESSKCSRISRKRNDKCRLVDLIGNTA